MQCSSLRWRLAAPCMLSGDIVRTLAVFNNGSRGGRLGIIRPCVKRPVDSRRSRQTMEAKGKKKVLFLLLSSGRTGTGDRIILVRT